MHPDPVGKTLDDLSDLQLGRALMAHAAGDASSEAAIELLAEQQSWLARSDFRAYVYYTPVPGDSGLAAVRLQELATAELKGSHSETTILRCAVKLVLGQRVELEDLVDVSWGDIPRILRASCLARRPSVPNAPRSRPEEP